MYRCIQPASKAFIEANQGVFFHPQTINGVPKDLNDVHSALKKQVCTWCIPCSTSTIRCWGSYFSIVLEMLDKSHQHRPTGGQAETSETCTMSKKGQFFFFYKTKKKKKINCMIKITYKCKVLPLKLDCAFLKTVLILTNLKRDSLLQYFLIRFSHNMTRIWQESIKKKKHWQEPSSSTCMMVRMRMMMMMMMP